ncbi:MAG: hypothetical protein COA63_009255 [Methylophaga sp.]|nr:hypothetical protein [Methylophaga sp.]
MKTITLICAILWAMATLFSMYNMIIGESSIFNLFPLSPIYAIQSIVWFFVHGATAGFFYVLWTKQS